MTKELGRLNHHIDVVDVKTGKATNLFSRLWADLCTRAEKETPPSELNTAYVAGAPAATGYALITIDGVQYKVLLAT